MRPIILAFVIITIGIAVSGEYDPYSPAGLGSGCTSTNYQSAGKCLASPMPTSTPTPTTFLHIPDAAADDEFGGVGISGATVRANVTLAEATYAIVSGTPKPIVDCTSLCYAGYYLDYIRISTGEPIGSDYATAATGATNDDWFLHIAGVVAPQPTSQPTPGGTCPCYPTAGYRVQPSNNNDPTILGANISLPSVLTYFNTLMQGTNANVFSPANHTMDNFYWIFADTDQTTLQQAMKQNATIEISDTAHYLSYLKTFQSGLVHADGVTPFYIGTNGFDNGKCATVTACGGDASCDPQNNCMSQFDSPNVLWGICEFCPQINSGPSIQTKPEQIPSIVNISSKADSLGRGIIILAEMECGGSACHGSVNGVNASVADRMDLYATWFFSYDTASPLQAANGQSLNAIEFADFNNHFNNINSLAAFDEEYLQPVGTPNVQAQAYQPGSRGSGLAGCSSGTQLHGMADYLLAGSCANGAGGFPIGVYLKCYPASSFRNVASGPICLFLNLTHATYRIQNADLPTGYGSLAHTYSALPPGTTCTNAPNCGDEVTGGTADSKCSLGPCLGSMTATTFVSGTTDRDIAADGGVKVATQ
jgi:hypothetical protein